MSLGTFLRPIMGHAGSINVPVPAVVGLQTGNVLDDLCPNMDHHRQGQNDPPQHPVSTKGLILSLKNQLNENIDRCIPLGGCGSYGAPFKLACTKYGYKVMGKGTTSGLRKEVSREAQVYQMPSRIYMRHTRGVERCYAEPT